MIFTPACCQGHSPRPRHTGSRSGTFRLCKSTSLDVHETYRFLSVEIQARMTPYRLYPFRQAQSSHSQCHDGVS